MNLREQIRLVLGRFWILVAFAILGGASAFLFSNRLPRTYEARASLVAPTMASTYAEVATSRPVLEHVISQLGLPMTPDALGDQVEARASQTSALLTVIAHDSEPSRAAAIATAVADRLVQLAPEITGSSVEAREAIQADLARLQSEIQRTEAAASSLSSKTQVTTGEVDQLRGHREQLAGLLAIRASLLDLSLSYSQSVLTVLAPAVVPTELSSPKVTFATSVGALAGLAIGIGILLFSSALAPGAQDRV